MLKNYSRIRVIDNDIKRYLNDEGKLHRLDGPAVEYSSGLKFWRINGNYHRNIDPVSEFSDGEKCWWFKDKRHRVGGMFSSYDKEWHIHSKEYSKQQYFNKVWDI